mgnify:CR=1 FL=1
MDDILIVEDDRALSQGIRLGLEGEGRRFIQTSTLDQGERALEERPFSLVVLDLNLRTAAAWSCSAACGPAPLCLCSFSPPTTWSWTRSPVWSWGRTTM